MLKYSNFCFRWGDVTLNTASDGARYLQLNERQTKTRTEGNLSDVCEVTPKIYEAEGESPERDPCRATVRNGFSIHVHVDVTDDTIESNLNEACFSYF
jgi:hypothetical protein